MHDKQNLENNVTNVVTEDKSEKVAYNPLFHSTNIVHQFTSKKIYKKRDKQTDKKRKSIIKEQHYTEQYNDLLLDNLLKQYYSTKVHIL